MNKKLTVIALSVLALAATPLAPAQAHGWDRGRGGYYHGHGGGWLLGAAAVVGGAAVALATLPFNLVEDITTSGPPPRPVYAQPTYYQPAAYQPAYYARPVYQQPAYYPQRQVVVYSGYPQQGYAYYQQ